MTTERDEAVLAVQTAIAEADGYADEFDYYRPHALAAIAALRDGEGCGTCGGRGWIDEGHLEDDGRMVSAPEDCPDCTPPAKQPEAQAVAWERIAEEIVCIAGEPVESNRKARAERLAAQVLATHPTTPDVGVESEPASEGVRGLVEELTLMARKWRGNTVLIAVGKCADELESFAAALATKPAKGGEE